MKVLLLPKGLLLAISLLIIIFGMLTARSTTDFHLHDTYFVVSNFHIGILVGGFFLLQTAVYFLTDNYRQWRSVQYFHVIGTGLLLLAAVSSAFYEEFVPPAPDRSFYYTTFLLEDSIKAIILFLFLPGQILFIINLIAGFIRGKKVLNRVR